MEGAPELGEATGRDRVPDVAHKLLIEKEIVDRVEAAAEDLAGAIEVPAATLEILNKSETPPFVVSSDEDVDDETLKCQLWTLQAVPTHSKRHIDRCQSVETGKQSAESCSHL